MYSADIEITDNQKVFNAGDTITGTARVAVPKAVPLLNVSVSFHCRCDLKWIDVLDVDNLPNLTHYEKNYIHDEKLDINSAHAITQVIMSPDGTSKNMIIPFSFKIPKNNELPSTMVSREGSVKYFIRLTLKHLESEKVKKFYKDVIVLAPFCTSLLISVAATAEKRVLLHNGTVTLQASIDRKGFAPGETIPVHVTVDNQTNASVVPQVSLKQTQIHSSGVHQRIVDCALNQEPIIGTEIASNSKVQQLLNVTVPENESLSMKSSLITVRYYLNVSLDIPHSFDLHVSLPLIVTSKTVIQQLHNTEIIL